MATKLTDLPGGLTRNGVVAFLDTSPLAELEGYSLIEVYQVGDTPDMWLSLFSGPQLLDIKGGVLKLCARYTARVAEYIAEEQFLNQITEEEGEYPCWMWCNKCHRCYLENETRYSSTADDGLGCPYEDCDGATWDDGEIWEKVRADHPEYPEMPERNIVYEW